MNFTIRYRRNGLLSVFLSLAVSLLAVQARADVSPGGGDPTIPTASSPGDEVTSLPVTAVDPSGLTLVGHVRDIRALVLGVEGQGRVLVTRLGSQRVAVTLMGDYRVVLDRRVLAQGNVNLLFRGGHRYGDGLAALSVAGGAPTTSSAERVPLPAARLAATSFAGLGLELVVREGDHRARGTAAYRGDHVVWTQRLR